MRIRGKKKSKLSKGILEMKFMKRSKEKVEREREEEEYREIFAHDLKEIKTEGQELILEPSFVSIDDLVCGRMSFKGMNPEVERLMEIEKQHALRKTNEEDRIKSNIPEIPDEEMAQYLGKKIKNKFSSKRTLHNDNSESDSSLEEELPKKAKFLKPADSD